MKPQLAYLPDASHCPRTYDSTTLASDSLGVFVLCPLRLQEDTSWVAMKTFLGKRSVKEDILSFDAHRILSTPGMRVYATDPF